MEQWKPWEKLELLKSVYYEPKIEEEEKNKYDFSVAPVDGPGPAKQVIEIAPRKLWP